MRASLLLLPMIGLALLLTALAASAPPSDHLDSPYIDNYPQRDIGDLFVWKGEQTGGPAFLINLNPLTAPSTLGMQGLDPNVVYEFKLDTDGDYVADLAYKISVEGQANGPGGTQTIWYEQRNAAAASVDWQFTNNDARIKLKRLYPNIDD